MALNDFRRVDLEQLTVGRQIEKRSRAAMQGRARFSFLRCREVVQHRVSVNIFACFLFKGVPEAAAKEKTVLNIAEHMILCTIAMGAL